MEYTLEELCDMKNKNTELWQEGGKLLVRRYIINELQSNRITSSEAHKLADNFGLEYEKWSEFGGGKYD